jgi:hypothetical protein
MNCHPGCGSACHALAGLNCTTYRNSNNGFVRTFVHPDCSSSIHSTNSRTQAELASHQDCRRPETPLGISRRGQPEYNNAKTSKRRSWSRNAGSGGNGDRRRDGQIRFARLKSPIVVKSAMLPNTQTTRPTKWTGPVSWPLGFCTCKGPVFSLHLGVTGWF